MPPSNRSGKMSRRNVIFRHARLRSVVFQQGSSNAGIDHYPERTGHPREDSRNRANLASCSISPEMDDQTNVRKRGRHENRTRLTSKRTTARFVLPDSSAWLWFARALAASRTARSSMPSQYRSRHWAYIHVPEISADCDKVSRVARECNKSPVGAEGRTVLRTRVPCLCS
jgi:hypothetical protein